MTRVIPTVARILHYFPAGMRDSVMVRRQTVALPEGSRPRLPFAAIVVDVISDNVVNLTVFDGLGETYRRVHVPMVDEANPYTAERCSQGWCQWPAITRNPLAASVGVGVNQAQPLARAGDGGQLGDGGLAGAGSLPKSPEG